MQYVTLGRTGLRVSRLGVGCSQIASISTVHTQAEVQRTLLTAFDRGINFFDTADIYGQGDSERLLGRLFRQKRSEVIICTKAGLTISTPQLLVRLAKLFAQPVIRRWGAVRRGALASRKRREGCCFRPSYLQRQIEGSLRRLRSDHLDVFLLHSPPSKVLEDETVFDVLGNFKRSGKIRYIGVSCQSARIAKSCLSRADIDCIQISVNVLRQETLAAIQPLATKQRVGVIGRSPLGGGEVLSSVTLANHCGNKPDWSPARVALQYLFQQSCPHLVLTGMTSRRHLLENLRALESPPLSDDDIALLTSSLNPPLYSQRFPGKQIR